VFAISKEKHYFLILLEGKEGQMEGRKMSTTPY
jgi:hypothetical protein